jgi:hypothetical protein|tara:strand:- start:6886 stop:7272 length:387 start_codon:yes stop_codon:yes gene_type:complete
MSILSFWKKLFGEDSKSPKEQFKESYQRTKIKRINPQSYEEGLRGEVAFPEEGEINLSKYEPGEHIPDSLSREEVVDIISNREKAKRARTVKGRFKADDKTTPEVNEAWESGKAPKKKAKVTRKKKKK